MERWLRDRPVVGVTDISTPFVWNSWSNGCISSRTQLSNNYVIACSVKWDCAAA
jgi:hypothetical protein